jgi:hypothetical protein
MAWYALCATDRDHPARAFALITASSERHALMQGDAMRRRGDLLFLPSDVRVTARPAGRREVDALLTWLARRPGTGESSRPPDEGSSEGVDFLGRDERRRLAFFEKLWRGDTAL